MAQSWRYVANYFGHWDVFLAAVIQSLARKSASVTLCDVFPMIHVNTN